MGHQDWTSAHDSAGGERDLPARIERELPQLLALARRLTREEHDAQDAVQDALERAWRARHQLRDPAASGGWLRSILARTVIDAHRRRADLTSADPQVLDLLIPDVEDAATVAAAAEDELALRAALRRLAPDRARAPRCRRLAGVGDRRAARCRDRRCPQAHPARSDAADLRPRRPRVTDAHPPAFACRDARAHAHDLLEGTLEETTRAEIQQHLDTCPSCPAALQAAAGVPIGLRAERGAVEIPEPLRARLDELVREADEAL